MNIKETYIEITNRCFLACKHCSSEARLSNIDIIDRRTIFRIIDESKGLGVQTIMLSGGEPLTHPSIEDIIFYAENSSLKVRMYSCGVLKKRNELTDLDVGTLGRLKQKGLKTLVFSLHGTPSVHDYITGVKGSYALVVSSMVNAKQVGLNIEIHMVPMKVNYEDLEHVLTKAKTLGISQVSLLRYVPQGRSKYNPQLQMTKANQLDFLNKIETIDLSQVRLGAPYTCLFQDRPNSCSAGKSKILIGPNGDVYPCEAFKSALKNKTSNIYRASLSEIWENDKMLNKLRQFKVSDVSTCNHCSFADTCQAGCHGQRYFITNSLEIGPDPICLQAK